MNSGPVLPEHVHRNVSRRQGTAPPRLNRKDYETSEVDCNEIQETEGCLRVYRGGTHVTIAHGPAHLRVDWDVARRLSNVIPMVVDAAERAVERGDLVPATPTQLVAGMTIRHRDALICVDARKTRETLTLDLAELRKPDVPILRISWASATRVAELLAVDPQRLSEEVEKALRETMPL